MKIKQKIFTTVLYLALSCLLAACGNNGGGNSPKYTMSDQTDTSKASGGILKTERGREIFQERCIVCHGITGDAGNSGNSKYTKAANLQISRIDSVSIINAIINGKEGMPMFGHSMPDSDLSQLVVYVRSLRKS